MGLCLSKKKVPTLPPPPPPPNDLPEKAKPTPSAIAAVAPKVDAEPAAEKRPVFVITHKKQSIAEAEEEKTKEQVIPSRKSTQQEEARASSAAEEIRPVAPVRTSSCTKEEVDAILIQCGRLSRSSSGKANENGAASGNRRYSGSKRSYDFDNERQAEVDDLEKGALRPSPNRRRATSRERGEDKSQRSGSRERASGSGGRRVSRSPGRRSDPLASSAPTAGDKPKQPGKMVSVPAREKGGATAAVDVGGSGVKKVAPAGGNRKAAASPRSRSPANSQPQPQSLSRSSSRKAEQSPYRRNPMTEIDDNTLNANKMNGSSNASKMQKPSPSQSQKTTEANSQTSNETKASNAISNCVREQLMSCRTKEQKQADPGKPESLSRKPRSRRTSRDFDQTVGLTSNSYNSIILEDIHHYHQQNNTNTAFSLPACVTKACSILEAVADLNSDNRSYDGDGGNSENGRFGRQSKLTPFVESELVVKDDLMEPSLHKYVTVRGEVEPQESAGSNSFAGQPWGSPWGPNSVDSTDRCWTARSNNEEEVEEEVIEEDRDLDDWGRRLRVSGTETGKKREFDRGQLHRRVSGTETGKKREFDRGQLHRSGTSEGRALSVSGAAAGTS